MFEILSDGEFKIIHLIDGDLLSEAARFINKGKADGINLNYINNWRTDLEPLRNLQNIKCLIINEYPPSMEFDYSAMQSLRHLMKLSIYTSDRKEIDFSNFPLLKDVSITWRPKAKSLFECINIQRLFINRYIGKDLSNFFQLKNLKFLRVNLGSVISLNGLRNIAGLEELMLMQIPKLEDIDDLLELKHLKRLQITNCKRIKNISAVKKMNIPKLILAGTTPDE